MAQLFPNFCRHVGNMSPGAGVASYTARAMARERHTAAAWPMAMMSKIGSATGFAQVETENTMSPSTGVCEGLAARAMPSCAATARRLSWALLRSASVATMAIVVLEMALRYSRLVRAESAKGTGL